MKKIHLVVDSTANVPVELLAQNNNLHKVALKLILGDKEWDEDVISASQLFTIMEKTTAVPRTSQPPLGAFIEVFEPIIADGSEIIVLTVAGGLSGTLQGAWQAAKMVGAQKIHVIDTKTTVRGILNLVEQALLMIAAGMTCTQIIAKLEQLVAATHTLLLPDSLEYLHKGGRIGGAAALFGTLFQIKPILYLLDGKVAVLDKVRTRTRAVKRLIAQVQNCAELDYISVIHSGAAAEAVQIQARLIELYPKARIAAVSEVSSALAVHAGPAAIAIMYQEKLE